MRYWNIAPSRRFRIKYGLLKSNESENILFSHMKYLSQNKDPTTLENCEACAEESCYKAEFTTGWTLNFEIIEQTHAIKFINFYQSS
jgi:hypothetical protein